MNFKMIDLNKMEFSTSTSTLTLTLILTLTSIINNQIDRNKIIKLNWRKL